MDACYICNKALTSHLYQSRYGGSVTSLSLLVDCATTVFLCEHCCHLQTDSVFNEAQYYASDYKISLNSDEDDQLYKKESGESIYRLEHQASTFIKKIDVKKGMEILDYGCAKAGTFFSMTDRPFDLYLFDVSDQYLPFWNKHIDGDHYSIGQVNKEWENKFDIITSFFALEHVSDPTSFMQEVGRLIKPGGIFYAIVPNTYCNYADFIVVDHLQHFSRTSIEYLVDKAGFCIQEIDEKTHRGAYIIIAKKTEAKEKIIIQKAQECAKAHDIADYWHAAECKINTFEKNAENKRSAIYGAGVYGSFILSRLNNKDAVDCFIDNNCHLHGGVINGKNILPPKDLPDDVEVIYAGLNPSSAKEILSDDPFLQKQTRNYFFL